MLLTLTTEGHWQAEHRLELSEREAFELRQLVERMRQGARVSSDKAATVSESLRGDLKSIQQRVEQVLACSAHAAMKIETWPGADQSGSADESFGD